MYHISFKVIYSGSRFIRQVISNCPLSCRRWISARYLFIIELLNLPIYSKRHIFIFIFFIYLVYNDGIEWRTKLARVIWVCRSIVMRLEVLFEFKTWRNVHNFVMLVCSKRSLLLKHVWISVLLLDWRSFKSRHLWEVKWISTHLVRILRAW